MSEIAAYSESLLINKNSELTLIINLPNDVWNEIFNYLNPLDVFCVFKNVCKAWRMLIIENNYLLKDYISILNIKNTKEYFNNINLLQKFKRYLFRKYIQQIAHQFAELQNLLNENNENNLLNNEMQSHNENKIIIEKLIEMNYYCNLFYISKDTESLKLENNSLFNNNFFTNLFTNFNPKQWLQQLWSPHSSSFDSYCNNQQQQQQELLQQNLQQTTMNDNNIYLIKSIILGNSGVGKTSFLKASILKEFEENAYVATIGVEFHSKTFNLGKNCPSFKLQLWDVTGTERFRSIINIYYKSAEGFFICFDLTNSDSFHCVKEWKEEIDKHTSTTTSTSSTTTTTTTNKKNKVIILLGIKLDLATNKQERKVERKEAEELEFEMELIYEEISNKEMINVDSPTWYLMLMQYCLNQFKRI